MDRLTLFEQQVILTVLAVCLEPVHSLMSEPSAIKFCLIGLPRTRGQANCRCQILQPPIPCLTRIPRPGFLTRRRQVCLSGLAGKEPLAELVMMVCANRGRLVCPSTISPRFSILNLLQRGRKRNPGSFPHCSQLKRHYLAQGPVHPSVSVSGSQLLPRSMQSANRRGAPSQEGLRV